MKASEKHRFLFLIQIITQIFIPCFMLCFMVVQKVEALNRNKVSAVYVFGDSTVDPGNNNFVNTAFKGNFPPYGRDFPNQVPTGRFSNGKLGTDFLASYMGLKELVPPYLDSKLSINDLITGGVIPILKQLEYFKECKKRLEKVLGKKRTENHMNKAVFFISAGTNDFVVNYFTLPVRRKRYSLLAYQHFVLQNLQEFIQNLRAEGGRKFLVAGLPPMGCLPIMITLNSDNAFLERGCLDKYSSVARDYNLFLQHELSLMQLNMSNPGLKISYIDVYGPLDSMIHAPDIFGFEQVEIGCCGSGYIETTFLCNKYSAVCSDPSKYVFWDSIHPSEKAYYTLLLASRPAIDALVNQ
ncbi:GDSL esterase/lipase At5g45960-like isoform X2 [Prosopis cineraria]|uniref:GDSL esterase/lipase At5g45960-like isoform X2 n=1 Tax=Prosopis cineraria TaxID=364024 RepID=UPI00240F4252|nr:GDSL esterase/lipase At5g45960-like isoform X2 [Prosopis cineraria]